MKHFYIILAIAVLWIMPQAVKADGLDTACDYTRVHHTSGSITGAVPCYGTLSQNETLYGIRVDVSATSTAGIYYQAPASTDTACHALGVISELGLQVYQLPVPLPFLSGTVAPVVFIYGDAGCTTSTAVNYFYAGTQPPAMYRIWYWSTDFSGHGSQTYDDPVGLEHACDLTSSDAGTLYLNTTWSLTSCLAELFTPTELAWTDVSGVNLIDELQTGLLSRFPLGYATRFLVIASGTATTTLPVLDVNFAHAPAAVAMITGGADLRLDPWNSLMGSTSILGTATSTYSGLTLRQIVEPGWDVFVILVFAFIILHDVMGISVHKKETPKTV